MALRNLPSSGTGGPFSIGATLKVTSYTKENTPFRPARGAAARGTEGEDEDDNEDDEEDEDEEVFVGRSRVE